MKTIVPDYYEAFRCIAGDCRRSCCIGWEIDIDKDTYAKYQAVPGTMGARLLAHIKEENGVAHFVLDEKERCPFLNEKGLCDIYTALGEDALCGICTEHPRFRNFFEDRTEIGLGLCCEAAAELILNKEEKTKLMVLKDTGEEETDEDDAACLIARDKIFAVLQDRTFSLEDRLRRLQREYEITFPFSGTSAWADAFFELEYMDDSFTEMLLSLKKENMDFFAPIQRDEIAFEQLAVYFIFRHFKDFWDEGAEGFAVGLMIISLRMIHALYRNEGKALLDIARLYSAEIEYSEENTEALTEYIELG